MESIPSRRRWYQISLAEWLILTTLLSVAWWQSARWPVVETVTVRKIVEQRGVAPIHKEETLVVGTHGPAVKEISRRCAIASASIVGVWLACSIAVHCFQVSIKTLVFLILIAALAFLAGLLLQSKFDVLREATEDFPLQPARY